MSAKAAEEEIARYTGCEFEIARAALKRATARSGETDAVSAATRLLQEGPAEAYAGCQTFGPGHGDRALAHPYVQLLLEVARGRVRDALAKQPGDDRWLICVRTYGRAGEPQVLSRLRHFVDQQWSRAGKDKAKLVKALVQAGVDSVDKLRQELQDLPALRAKLKGAFSPQLSSLEELQQATFKKPAARAPDDLKVTLRVKRPEQGILDMTLGSLERALGVEEAAMRCLVFVSHEDKAFTSGDYAAALKGSPWEHRLVVGVKGAHLQVRFIEEAAPLGAHIVIADDNINDFVVECVSQKLMDKLRREGFQEYMMRALSESFSEHALGGTGLSTVEESELQRFVRAAVRRCPVSAKKAVVMAKAVEEVLAARGLDDVPKLEAALAGGSPGHRDLKADLRAKGLYRVLRRLMKQVGQPLPIPNLLAVQAGMAPQRPAGPELAQLIRHAGDQMRRRGTNLWGVSPSKNHYWMHSFGDAVRGRARNSGIFKDFTDALGLVYGAFFGLRVLHEPRRYTRYGQVKDDVERSLRYWHCDGTALRFLRYAVVKNRCDMVGKFHAMKGGISAASSAELHQAEATRALTGMLDEFASSYARLAAPGEATSCGLVWRQARAPPAGRRGAEARPSGRKGAGAASARRAGSGCRWAAGSLKRPCTKAPPGARRGPDTAPAVGRADVVTAPKRRRNSKGPP